MLLCTLSAERNEIEPKDSIKELQIEKLKIYEDSIETLSEIIKNTEDVKINKPENRMEHRLKFVWAGARKILPIITTLIVPTIIAIWGAFIAIKKIRINIFAKARIEWIKELRSYLVDMLVASNEWQAFNEDEKKKSNEIIRNIEKNAISSRLYLNPEDEAHKPLLRSLKDLEYVLVNNKQEKYNDTLEDVISKSHNVLKQAWEQSKSLKQ